MAIEVEAEILDRIGDIRATISCREDLCSRSDATLVDKVDLASAQFRYGERDAARDTVHGIKASDICHDPLSILKLAQLKLLLDMAGHLDDAYLARRCGIDDPTVHLAYFAMFLAREKEWVEPDCVGLGLCRSAEERVGRSMVANPGRRRRVPQPP